MVRKIASHKRDRHNGKKRTRKGSRFADRVGPRFKEAFERHSRKTGNPSVKKFRRKYLEKKGRLTGNSHSRITHSEVMKIPVLDADVEVNDMDQELCDCGLPTIEDHIYISKLKQSCDYIQRKMESLHQQIRFISASYHFDLMMSPFLSTQEKKDIDDLWNEYYQYSSQLCVLKDSLRTSQQ